MSSSMYENRIYIQSPVGCIVIGDNGTSITTIGFVDEKKAKQVQIWKPEYENGTDKDQGAEGNRDCPSIREAEQLTEYFAGKRKVFDLPLEPYGTEFQKKVWQALMEIPYGRTCSYGEIAAKIGNPKASRAVGSANNKNPIAIVIPCHRVVGANGALVGYASGLQTKEALLKLEGIPL